MAIWPIHIGWVIPLFNLSQRFTRAGTARENDGSLAFLFMFIREEKGAFRTLTKEMSYISKDNYEVPESEVSEMKTELGFLQASPINPGGDTPGAEDDGDD